MASKAIVLLFIVAVTSAATIDLSRDQKPPHHEGSTIQLGSVGSYSAHLAGELARVETSSGGTPTYRFSSVVKGSAVPETDFLKTRCSLVEDFFVPVGPSRAIGGAPVLLCRSVEGTQDVAFLLYSDKLPAGSKRINLLLGRAAYQNFVASHGGGSAGAAEGRQIYGYGITATSPTGFASVSSFGTGGVVTWTSGPQTAPRPAPPAGERGEAAPKAP